MKRSLPIALALVITAPALAQYDPNSASAYAPSCQAALDIAQGRRPAADSPEAAKQLQRAAACHSAMTAILNLQPFFKPEYGMCPPGNAKPSPAQMVTTIAAYLKSHPEQLRENFHQVAVTALAAAWPCEK
jgi:hypothetical protein